MSKILFIAYHYPPCAGSTGYLRTLKFSRYLPDFGWQPVVLTANLRAHEMLDPNGNKSIPENVPILRAFAFDTKRHLGIRGSYLKWLALPDRWVSWVFGGAFAGLKTIRQQRVEVVVTTFPIASAVLMGLVLHVLVGRPWIVDLRDSMTEDDYPHDALTRRFWRWIEKQAMKRASRVIFTAPSARKMYLERYPGLLSPQKCCLIPNGYDEEDFARLSISSALPGHDHPLRLLHTGLLYPEERDPRPFFSALARLKREGRVSPKSLEIVFRAPGEENFYQRLLAQGDLLDLVKLKSRIPYDKALQECADADGLLLFQASNCDHQIPAKAYEYLRIGKPILALTTHQGDTAALLNEIGGATVVSLNDEDEIHRAMPGFLSMLTAGSHPLPDVSKVRRYERRRQAETLANVLRETVSAVPRRRGDGVADLRGAGESKRFQFAGWLHGRGP